MNLEEFLLVFEEHTGAKKKVIQAVLADVDRVDPEDFSLFFGGGGGFILILNIKIIYHRLFFNHLRPGASTGDPGRRNEEVS